MKSGAMKIGNLIEVGVAVTDLDAASRTFGKLLGTRATDSIRAPMFSMEFRMCRLGDVDFELMMPYADNSVVNRFISSRGEGLHHVAFQVSDLDETISQCRSRGVPVLSGEPVVLGGLRAIFLHPACMSGLLVEFVENLHTWSFSPSGDNIDRPQSAGRIAGFGVAVKDIDAAASNFATVLGAEISDRCWNEALGAHVRDASVNGIRFELLPSSASQIDVAKLDRDKQGLHHVCLQVPRTEAFAAIRKRSEDGVNAEMDRGFLTEPQACHDVMFEIQAADMIQSPHPNNEVTARSGVAQNE